MNPDHAQLVGEIARKTPFWKTRRFGVVMVWALIFSAAVGTYALTRDLTEGKRNAASVYLGAERAHIVSLFKDRIEPTTLQAKVGDEIVFLVRDSSYHNIAQDRESRSQPRLESGELKEGDSYSLVFSTPGNHSFYDRLNLDLRVTVVVK